MSASTPAAGGSQLTRSKVVLRARTVADLLDLACLVCGAHALGVYVRLGALVLLPCFGAVLALWYVAGAEPWLVWAATLLLAGLAQGPFTIAAGRWLFSESLGAREVLVSFARQLPRYVLAMAISTTMLALSTLVLITPWAAMRLMFVREACLLERAGASEASRRSSRFVVSRRTGGFSLWLGLLVAQVGLVVTAEVLGQGIVDQLLQLGTPFGTWQGDGISPFALFGVMLSAPYVATARFLMYVDTRTRADGWDIQVRFMSIAAEARLAGVGS